MHKKLLALTLALIMLISLAACKPGGGVSSDTPSDSTPAERLTISVGALKGPSGIGMAKLMEYSHEGTTLHDYKFTLEAAPDMLVPLMVQGELDIALLPTNLAANLYGKTDGGIELVTINTLGVLYVLENGDSITSLSDLRGQTLHATAKGSTPEYVLGYLLAQNGLADEVTVEYRAEHSELAAVLAEQPGMVALLPQPFVTSVMMKNPDIRIVADLNTEWEAVVPEGSLLAMSGIVVQKSLLDSSPQAVADFLTDYRASVEFTNAEGNAAEVAALCEKYGIIAAAVAERAIPYCSIVFIEGDAMKTAAEGFLSVLFEAEPASVGGALPGSGFYRTRITAD